MNELLPAVQIRVNMTSARESRPWQEQHDDERPYVSAWHDGEWCVVGFAFGRMRDAEAACDALKRAGLDTGDKLLKAGVSEVRRIMASALQW